MAGQTYSSVRKLGQAKAREFSIIDKFTYGYRNREDVTNTAPGILTVGSQNVITNVSERIQIRQGYSVDGVHSDVAAPVLSSYDWLRSDNTEIHMRVGGLTSAGNDGKMQYRYVASDGTVTWQTLLTGLTTVNYNFAVFFDTTNNLREVLFVNGSSNIYMWTGATATLSSANNTAGHIAVLNATPTNGGTGYTVGDVLTITTGGTGGTATVLTVDGSGAITAIALTTVGSGYTTGTGKATSGGSGGSATLNITTVATGQIVITGSTLVQAVGFTPTGSVIINGNSYNYTALVGESFLGISPNSSAEPVGSLIVQGVVSTANASLSGVPATFTQNLISTLNNQVFIGSTGSSFVYISQVSSYTNFSFSTPRQSGEGWVFPLDGNVVGFMPQENYMYITAGQDLWYNVSFQLQTSTVGITYEQVNALPLKTGKRQAAISQAFLSHMKNDIIVVTQETTVDTFGRVESSLVTPQTTNISDPIKLDIDAYDFTDGSIAYWRYYILVAVPKEGIVRIFNLATKSWEAPQTIPVSRFYIVDGELYAHSYNTFESYQLFTGYADRVYSGFAGFPIAANWVFSYQNYGSRFSYKKATKAYIEGYINANTTLSFTLTYELDGCQTVKMFSLDGSDSQFVCISGAEGSLGKESLGKIKLGGQQSQSIQGLPPKFRWFPTFNNTDFFECSFSFSVLGTDERAELLGFGLAVSGSSEIPVQNYA